MSRQTWHIISPEYPPQLGGVGDYVYLLANELADRGDEVHVWCAGPLTADGVSGRVEVHRTLGRLNPADLGRVGRELDRFPNPRHIVLQWVPHAYGWRSMNVPFCVWMWFRARVLGDDLAIMVHEPFLAFWEGNWRQNWAALVHRVMTVLLLNATQRAWVSTPRWEKAWKPYALGRRVPFTWLPLPSNVPVRNDKAAIAELRARYAPAGQCIVGHFGTFGYPITPMLEEIVPRLLSVRPDAVLLFIGPKGPEFKERIVRNAPQFQGRIHATGAIPATEGRLSAHLAACDVMIQPYPDGVSSRRTSLLGPLSHGVPIVTTTGASTEPLWRESNAVAIVGARDIEQFVAEACRLLCDEGARESATKNAKILYARYFAIEKIADALRSVCCDSEKPSPAQVVV